MAKKIKKDWNVEEPEEESQEIEEFVFRGQRDDEDVLQVMRQHPWVMLKTGIMIVVLANIMVFTVITFGASMISSIAVFGFLLITIISSWYRWFLWKNSVDVLTDQRVLKIEQKSLFFRTISECELDRIQDIATEIKGPVSTMFNFGDISIQTASSQAVISLEKLPDPYEIQQKIVKPITSEAVATLPPDITAIIANMYPMNIDPVSPINILAG